MKNITIDYIQSSTITTKEFSDTQHILNQEIQRLIDTQSLGYTTHYASINLPSDQQLIQQIKTIATKMRSLNPTMLVVIGIGGSNLGTAALVQGLYGALYNDTTPLKIYFADTVDADYIHEIIARMEQELSAGNTILINVISKSGTTTETIANFCLLFNILKKYQTIDYRKYVVITTDRGSPLHQYAEEEMIDALIIPDQVGGRYSVFSAVGLFPLAVVGVDIEELCTGARSAQALCTNKNYQQNPAAISAIMMHLLYKKGFTIHNLFIFSVALENMGKWYRQLMAESIGKAYDNNNTLVHNGILPIVSIGSTDLHSMAQLYLSGPYNISTTFLSIENDMHDFTINYNNRFTEIAPTIQGKSYKTVINAILDGTKIAYQKDKRPFVQVTLPARTAYYLGQFMQIKMYEIMYLGFLMNINPFDQPQVELYKKETREILNNASSILNN